MSNSVNQPHIKKEKNTVSEEEKPNLIQTPLDEQWTILNEN